MRMVVLARAAHIYYRMVLCQLKKLVNINFFGRHIILQRKQYLFIKTSLRLFVMKHYGGTYFLLSMDMALKFISINSLPLLTIIFIFSFNVCRAYFIASKSSEKILLMLTISSPSINP